MTIGTFFPTKAGKVFGAMVLAVVGVGLTRRFFAPGTFVGDFVDGNF